ncbi:MAG: hypothetical protein ACE15C_01710 [Phycisphaerae bacterium]
MQRALIALLLAALVGGMTGGLRAEPSSISPRAVSSQPSRLRTDPLAKEQEDELLGFLKENGGTEKLRQLLDAKVSSPDGFNIQARFWYTWMTGIKSFPPKYWPAYVQQIDAMTRAAGLIAKLRVSVDESEKARLIDDLRTEVTRRFDAEMLIREHRLFQLKEQLTLAEDELARSRKNRDQAVSDSIRSWLLTTQPAPTPSVDSAGTKPVPRGVPRTTTSRPASAPVLKPLTKAQEDELLDFFKKMGSDKAALLANLRDTNPQTYQTMARAWYWWMAGIKRNPEKYWKAYVAQQEAHTRATLLVDRLKTPGDEVSRAAIMEELRKEVALLVDAQLLISENSLSQLRDRLAQLEADLDRTQKNREKLIADSVEQWVRSALPQPTTKPAG